MSEELQNLKSKEVDYLLPDKLLLVREACAQLDFQLLPYALFCPLLQAWLEM